MYLALGVFLLRSLIGFLLMELLWPHRNPAQVLLKISLGIGMGLGISSLLYFLYLLAFAGQHFFLWVELSFLLVLIGLYARNRGLRWRFPEFSLDRIQILLMMLAAIVFIASFLGTINYVVRRTHGDWDAWMIYNRTARFVYRDQEFWKEAFSDKLDTFFHPDYPLLLSMNVASGWEILADEIMYVPMIQSILFSIASLLTLAAALALIKSIGQGVLGIILLWSSPFFVYEGGRQTADLPLSFFILASVVVGLLYYSSKETVLMALAGFFAGLAAWTKNEGLLFVVTSGTAVIIHCLHERSLKALYFFVLGLMLPLGINMYFKYFLAPPSEFLRDGVGQFITKVLDFSRHKLIAVSFFREFLRITTGGLSIFPFLLLYLLLFYSGERKTIIVYSYGITVILMQLLGYYGTYLVTPYDLQWHMTHSLERLFVQLFPTTVFLVLSGTRVPENIFDEDRT